MCKFILPLVSDHISTSLNCYSTLACKNCLLVIEELLIHDPSMESVANLCTAILKAFETHLKALCFPSLTVESVSDLQNNRGGLLSRSYLARQVWFCRQLAEHWWMFQEILSKQVVCGFAWDMLLKCAPSLGCLLETGQMKVSHACGCSMLSSHRFYVVL